MTGIMILIGLHHLPVNPRAWAVREEGGRRKGNGIRWRHQCCAGPTEVSQDIGDCWLHSSNNLTI